MEVIRRLRLEPEVEMIATGHRHDNGAVAALFPSLGFVPWEIEGMALKPSEVYLRVPDARSEGGAP